MDIQTKSPVVDVPGNNITSRELVMQTNQAGVRPLAASKKRIEAILAAETSRLQQLMGALDDQIKHPAGTATGDWDKAWGFEDRIAERDLLHRCQIELREVYLAIDKLQQGRYGTCERCSRPIALERVGAMPAAAFCVDCASTDPRRSGPAFTPRGEYRQ
jgi:RNA polymerase-binding transcription factor DksA